MAIAIDATSGNFVNPGTSLTISHTCTGANRILWVEVWANGGDTITGVTYAGTAMTQMAKTAAEASAFIYLFYLANPASGANNYVVSSSASVIISAAAASYTGAKQTGIPDAQVTNTVLAGQTSITTTVTVVADQSWLVGTYRNNVGNWTAGANTVLRANDGAGNGNSFALVDSNSAQAPGSRSMTATVASATVAGIMASFAPAAVAGATLPYRSLLGVGI